MKAGAPLLHAGSGISTVAATLFTMGHDVVCVDADPRRCAAAARLRDRAATLFPLAKGRCEIVQGYFPHALESRFAGRAFDLLLLTNFDAGAPDRLQASIIAAFPQFANVMLDLRRFGRARETVAERDALRARIEATQPAGIRDIATAGASGLAGAHYVHITY